MGKVYIPQEPRARDPATGDFRAMYDFTPALKFGQIEVLLPPGPVMIATAPMMRTLRAKLKNFSDDDYVIAVGDPGAIAGVVMMASSINHGRIKLLCWDRRVRDYLQLNFSLHERTNDEYFTSAAR